jgi:hypothetical protein
VHDFANLVASLDRIVKRNFPADEDLTKSLAMLKDRMGALDASLQNLKIRLVETGREPEARELRGSEVSLSVALQTSDTMVAADWQRLTEAVFASLPPDEFAVDAYLDSLVEGTRLLLDLAAILATQRPLAPEVAAAFRDVVATQRRLVEEAGPRARELGDASVFRDDVVDDLAWLQRALEERTREL